MCRMSGAGSVPSSLRRVLDEKLMPLWCTNSFAKALLVAVHEVSSIVPFPDTPPESPPDALFRKNK